MPSRKRNKGKDRKARKAENKRVEIRNTWQAWARGEFEGQQEDIILCRHVACGNEVDTMISEDGNHHPVCSFMDTYFGNWNAMTTTENLRDTYQKHTEVWKSESYKKIAVNILVRIGTNFSLNKYTGPRTVALAIVVLENYDGGDEIESTVNYRVVATKFRDLHCCSLTDPLLLGNNGGVWSGSSILRDALKFFRKRIACSCLKEMHLQARKTQSKLGICIHCGKVKERAMLMVCGRCGIMQYCSRGCQRADWPSHKRNCNIHVSTHAQQKSKKGFSEHHIH